MLDGTPIYCACDLIAKVREDERERAGIEQKTPTPEYPFTTVVTVEAAMTDMQRWEVALVNASGSGYRTRQSETGQWVRFADAEAAIASAEQQAHWLIAALVHLYGGAVTITVRDLLALDRNPVLKRFDNPDGSITLRALEEKP
jgi:hypothetical protein